MLHEQLANADAGQQAVLALPAAHGAAALLGENRTIEMHRHLKMIIGRWKLEDWRLYRWTEHRDAKTGGNKARWHMWDRVLVRDFLRGLSIVGLARKYGRTREQIEAALRRAL